MDRKHFTPYDPHNFSHSYYGSYDSSHISYNSSLYRDNGYPIPYGELPISNPQWSGQQHQMVNPYHNTNLGWNEHQNFQRDEGYNYGAPNYQWGSSSYFEMPNLPTMTNPFQHSPPPRNDDVEILLKSMVDTDSHANEIQKIFDQESNSAANDYLQLALKRLADNSSKLDEMLKIMSESPSTPEKSTEVSSSQLEKLEEQHIEDFVLQPTLDVSEQQHRVHEPSVEDNDSEDVDEIIEIDDRPPSSPPLPSRETSSMQAEIRMHDFDSLACDELTQSMVLEPKEEQEESPSPPLPPYAEQLEPKTEPILTPPFIVDFVISSQSFHTPLCLYDFISLCDADVKEARTEEYFSDQREGNMLGSLQRRHLLPLWIFKENLKPD